MKKILRYLMVVALLVYVNFGYAQETKLENMTLQDAVFMALKNSLDLQVQKIDTEIAGKNLKIYKNRFWIPTLEGYLYGSKTKSPSSDFLSGSTDVSTSKNLIGDLTLTQPLPWGGSLAINADSSWYKSNSSYSFVNPNINSQLKFTLNQPLLKGFGMTSSKYNIYIAANNNKISQLQLKENVIQLIFDVESAYWELVYAHQNLEASQKALERARDLLKQNEIKMKVGTIGAIEVLSAKAEVARNESSVISAERTIQTNERALKRILNLNKDNISITPTDKPDVRPVPVDYKTFLDEALKNRTDINRARLNLENNNIQVKYAKNLALPSLNLLANYYTKGSGGTRMIFREGASPFDPNFNPETDIIGFIKKSAGDTWTDVFKSLYKNYNFQVSFELPVSFAANKAEVAVAKYGRDKALLQYHIVENTVYSEVKEVIMDLETNKKLVEADNLAMELEGENLKAEEKKLEVGISTNFNVITIQQQYAQAQVQALRSTINYALTIARLNRILNRSVNQFGLKFNEITIEKK